MTVEQPRTLKAALANAERIREEFPRYIQPSSTDYDMVILADRVAEVEKITGVCT